MSSTPLQEKFAGAGAQFSDYGGARAVASFGDPQAELRALLESSAVYDLNWRGKLVLSGDDRVRWLNGMVTGNVRDLPLNRGTYAFVLNPQGRIQGDLYAFQRGEYLLVTTDLEQLPTLTAIFERYIIMDDVDVGDVTDKLASIGLAGPLAVETLAKAGMQVSALHPLEVADITWNDVGLSITRGDSEQNSSFEIWFHPDNATVVWDALVSSGAVPVGTEALEWRRILLGVPRFGVDIAERDLPQETAQDRALHYSKGCYVGQEIVERIHSRGNVHRQLTGFELPAPVERGTKVRVGDKDVGEITTSARVPLSGGERTLALGYLRREHAAPGTQVHLGETTAKVASLPFKK